MDILKRYVPFIVACLFAAVSTVGVYQYLKGREHENVVLAKTDTTMSVVVAKHGLSMGMKLGAHDLTTQQWPKDIVTEDYFQNAKEVIGKTLRTNVIADEPLTTGKLLGEGENISTLIPPDMRAITVAIRKSSTLARVLERGSLVDVIAILEKDGATMNTKVIAQAVRVLSVDDGSTFRMDNSKGSESNFMEVMLLVSPRDADWIVYARNQGIIDLVIRNDRMASVKIEDGI